MMSIKPDDLMIRYFRDNLASILDYLIESKEEIRINRDGQIFKIRFYKYEKKVDITQMSQNINIDHK